VIACIRITSVVIQGKTALHWSCTNGRITAVEMLIDYGVKTQLKDKVSSTTSILLCSSTLFIHACCVSCIIQLQEGKTPLELLKDSGQKVRFEVWLAKILEGTLCYIFHCFLLFFVAGGHGSLPKSPGVHLV
jgi:ankyrin repeat protein